MNKLLITYDLGKPNRNYEGLYKKLQSYYSWCPLQDSVWIVATGQSTEDVFRELGQLLDKDDELLVTKLDPEFMSTSTPQMHENIFESFLNLMKHENV